MVNVDDLVAIDYLGNGLTSSHNAKQFAYPF